MALRHCDSFDYYATADLLLRYTTLISSPSINTTNGRNSTGSLRGSGGTRGVTKTLDAQATWYIGFAVRFTELPGGVFRLITLYDGTTLHLDVRLNPSGVLTTTRNGTLLATGTIVLAANTYYFLEFRGTIADSGGRSVVKVNGVTDIDFTGDTRNAGNATANIIELQFGSSSATYDLDDLYICDANGGVNDTFLGDVRVAALLPNGNGNSSQHTGSDGNSTDNYLLVDETPFNSDTDYVESSTAGHIDTYAMANLPSTATSIKAIQQVIVARKTDAGARSARIVLRHSSTNYESADIALTDTYAIWTQIRDQDPSAASWTESNVNALEHGPKCQS